MNQFDRTNFNSWEQFSPPRKRPASQSESMSAPALPLHLMWEPAATATLVSSPVAATLYPLPSQPSTNNNSLIQNLLLHQISSSNRIPCSDGNGSFLDLDQPLPKRLKLGPSPELLQHQNPLASDADQVLEQQCRVLSSLSGVSGLPPSPSPTCKLPSPSEELLFQHQNNMSADSDQALQLQCRLLSSSFLSSGASPASPLLLPEKLDLTSPCLPKKKTPTTTKTASCLNEDALAMVMEFLAPRELLRLSLCSKSLLARLTTRLVVRCALMHGGHAKRTLEELFPLMKRQSVHAPSPLRLLRLVNGKKCEFCRDAKVNFCKPSFGWFACADCHTSRLTVRLKCCEDNHPHLNDNHHHHRYGTKHEILHHERVVACKTGNHQQYTVSRRPQKTRDMSREDIGPLVTLRHICQALRQLKNDHGEHASPEAVREYLQKELEYAPASDYQKFLQAYEESHAEAEQAALARSQKRQRARVTSVQNRQKKVETLLSELGGLLHETWRDVALLHNEDWQASGTGIRFDSAFVHGLLREYVQSPSKLKKKTLGDLADLINQHFEMLVSILGLTVLHETTDPFQSALKQLCEIQQDPDLLSLMSMGRLDGSSVSGDPTTLGSFLEAPPVNSQFLNCNLSSSVLPAKEVARATPSSLLQQQEQSLASSLWSYLYVKAALGVDDAAPYPNAQNSSVASSANGNLGDYMLWLDQLLCKQQPESADALKHLYLRDFARLKQSLPDFIASMSSDAATVARPPL